MNWMLLPLKRYAQFSGRSRRMEYGMWLVLQVLIAVAFSILMIVVGGSAAMVSDAQASAFAAGGAIMIIAVLNLLVTLALFIPSMAVSVRRLHDLNWSGWLVLLPLLGWVLFSVSARVEVPGLMIVGGLLLLLGGILGLLMLFMAGTDGPNKYGEDPKGGGSVDVEGFS